MNAIDILLEVCRFIHLDFLANLGDDIYQKLGAHHDEVLDVDDERDGGNTVRIENEDEGPALDDCGKS